MKKTTGEMIAEALREIGVLAIVLLPLDVVFSPHVASWATVLTSFSAGVLLLFLGIILERIRS